MQSIFNTGLFLISIVVGALVSGDANPADRLDNYGYVETESNERTGSKENRPDAADEEADSYPSVFAFEVSGGSGAGMYFMGF